MYSPSSSLWSTTTTTTSSSSTTTTTSISTTPPPPPPPIQGRLQNLLWLHRNSHTSSSDLLLKL